MGRAKDFLLSVAETPSVETFDRGSYTEEVWAVRGANMRVIGNQITLAHGDAEGLYVLLLALVKKLREQKPWKLKQLDQWLIDSEGTRAMHQALARAIERGELEEGDSRGNWNEFYIVYPQVAEGQAKDFFKELKAKPVYCRLFGGWAGSKALYWSRRIRAWTLKDDSTLLRLDKLQEPLPEGSRALEIVNAEGGTIASGPCWPLEHWKRKYLPGYSSVKEGVAKGWMKARSPGAIPVVFGNSGWPGIYYWSEASQAWGPRDQATVYDLRTFDGVFPPGTYFVERCDGYTAQVGITGVGDADRTPAEVRSIFDTTARPHLRLAQEGEAQQFLKHAYPQMRTKMALRRRRCEQCGDVFSEEESARYKCERGQCPSCLSRNTVLWGVQEGQAKDFVRGAWQQHVAQTPDGKLIALLQGYGFKRVAGRGPEDPREIWQVTLGTVTHTVQRGGPGTMWFYRRNTVPDYNFASGPINMRHSLPRYLGVQEAEEQLDFELPYAYKAGHAKRTVKLLHQRMKQSRGRSGDVIDSGRKFRRLVGTLLVKAVYVWEEKENMPGHWGNGRLVVEISLSQGHGRYTSWFIQQNWASFSVLCHALRTWRNLQGADLYINGDPSGKIAYRNPRLVELGS